MELNASYEHPGRLLAIQTGWALAFCAVPIVIIVDAGYKTLRRFRSRELALASGRITSGGRR